MPPNNTSPILSPVLTLSQPNLSSPRSNFSSPTNINCNINSNINSNSNTDADNKPNLSLLTSQNSVSTKITRRNSFQMLVDLGFEESEAFSAVSSPIAENHRKLNPTSRVTPKSFSAMITPRPPSDPNPNPNPNKRSNNTKAHNHHVAPPSNSIEIPQILINNNLKEIAKELKSRDNVIASLRRNIDHLTDRLDRNNDVVDDADRKVREEKEKNMLLNDVVAGMTREKEESIKASITRRTVTPTISHTNNTNSNSSANTAAKQVAKITELQTLISDLESKCQTLTTASLKVHQQHLQTTQSMSTIQQQSNESNARIRSLELQNVKTTNALNDCVERFDESQTQLHKKTKLIDDLNTNVKTLSRRINVETSLNLSNRTQWLELKGKLDDDNSLLNLTLSNSNDDGDSLKSTISEMQGKICKLENLLQRVSNDVDELDQYNHTLLSDNANCKSAIQQASRERNQFEKAYLDEVSSKEEALASVDAVNEQLVLKNVKLDEIQRFTDTLLEEALTLRHSVRAYKEDEIKRNIENERVQHLKDLANSVNEEDVISSGKLADDLASAIEEDKERRDREYAEVCKERDELRISFNDEKELCEQLQNRFDEITEKETSNSELMDTVDKLTLEVSGLTKEVNSLSSENSRTEDALSNLTLESRAMKESIISKDEAIVKLKGDLEKFWLLKKDIKLWEKEKRTLVKKNGIMEGKFIAIQRRLKSIEADTIVTVKALGESGGEKDKIISWAFEKIHYDVELLVLGEDEEDGKNGVADLINVWDGMSSLEG